jgi:prolyl-tRNA synthetase
MSSHSRKASVNKPDAAAGKATTPEKEQVKTPKPKETKELPIGKPEAKQPTGKAGKKKKIEGAALIGIDVAKEDDFPGWYQQVLLKGDMLDYYDVSGCYILKVYEG